jgi:hypothetical protein
VRITPLFIAALLLRPRAHHPLHLAGVGIAIVIRRGGLVDWPNGRTRGKRRTATRARIPCLTGRGLGGTSCWATPIRPCLPQEKEGMGVARTT